MSGRDESQTAPRQWNALQGIWGFIYAYLSGAVILASFDDRGSLYLLLGVPILLGPPAALYRAFKDRPRLDYSFGRRALIAVGYYVGWAFAFLVLALMRHLTVEPLALVGAASAWLALGFFLSLRLSGKAVYVFGAPVAAMLAWALAMKILKLVMVG